MTPKDVIETVGFPDYVESCKNIHQEGPWELAWRYDIDAKLAYTLLLVWDGHAVKKIEKISPQHRNVTAAKNMNRYGL